MKAIVAVDNNWGIGNNNSIPWHIPEDIKFFKETTLDNVVIMGRKTLESLPNKKPLKDRINIILTNTIDKIDNAIIVNSISELLYKLNEFSEEKYVIGGANIYEQLIQYCDEILVTKINNSFETDKYFSNLDLCNDWKLTKIGEIKKYNDIEYHFDTYIKCKRGD